MNAALTAMESLYIVYLLLCGLAAAVAIAVEIRARRRRREEPMEYLGTWSEARRLRKRQRR